jgi:hypothetical protein
MIVSIRIRLNVRLPDAEKKYRDELTQEAEVSLDETDAGLQSLSLDELVAAARCKALELRSSFYQEAHRLGAADYQE